MTYSTENSHRQEYPKGTGTVCSRMNVYSSTHRFLMVIINDNNSCYHLLTMCQTLSKDVSYTLHNKELSLRLNNLLQAKHLVSEQS